MVFGQNNYIETGKKRCIKDDCCARSIPEEKVGNGSLANYHKGVSSDDLEKCSIQLNEVAVEDRRGDMSGGIKKIDYKKYKNCYKIIKNCGFKYNYLSSDYGSGGDEKYAIYKTKYFYNGCYFDNNFGGNNKEIKFNTYKTRYFYNKDYYCNKSDKKLNIVKCKDKRCKVCICGDNAENKLEGKEKRI